MTTTAQIAAKGCSSTGITEDLAKRLHDSLGKTIVAVVELTSENRSENRDGDEKVKLVINTIEPAPEGMAADHVRELARSFHYERKLADGETDGQLPLPGDSPEPKVEEVLAAGEKLKHHAYDHDPFETEPICVVCGQTEDATIHQDIPEPDAEPDEE
jgi:hypothetical protein